MNETISERISDTNMATMEHILNELRAIAKDAPRED